MLPKQYTLEEMLAALEATELPPLEGFERMVRNGIINRKGQVTRLVGGEAEPEPGAKRPTTLRPSVDNCANMNPLSERLKNWRDRDGAEHELGVVLGVFEDTPPSGFWLDHAAQWIFWSTNPLGNALHEILQQLLSVGILEENDDGQLRWNSDNAKKLST